MSVVAHVKITVKLNKYAKNQYRLNKYKGLRLIIKTFLGQKQKLASSLWPTALTPERIVEISAAKK